MKKTRAFFAFLALIIAALTSGCMSSPRGLNPAIKTDGYLSTVAAGETLNFRASGQYIIWEVSSSSGGFQPAAEGTFISQRGLLTVAVDEPASFLYVTARSAKNGRSDTKQIRVVTVDAVSIIPANLSVEAGRTSQFVARVVGNNYPDHAVIWRVSSNADGTGAVAWGTSINENGLLRVSSYERASVLYVFATSVLDLRVYGSVFIHVNPVYVVHYSTTPTVFLFPSTPHSRHPNNHPHNNPHPNPPANPPNDRPNRPDDRPHSRPEGDNPHNNPPRSNPSANTPDDRPHSRPERDNPPNNPRANPSTNTQDDRYLDPPAETPPNNRRSNPSANSPSNRPHSNPQRDNPNSRYIEPPEDPPPPRSKPSENTRANNSRRSENRR